jgi:plastocyanin
MAKLLFEISIFSIAFSICTITSYAFAQMAPNQMAPNQMAPNQMAPNQMAPPSSQTISIVLGSSSPLNPRFYDPQFVSIKAGTVVTWINNDNSLHTVTFVTPGIFDSGNITAGQIVSNLFSDRGVFNYYCKLHPYMTGQVTVS